MTPDCGEWVEEGRAGGRRRVGGGGQGRREACQQKPWVPGVPHGAVRGGKQRYGGDERQLGDVPLQSPPFCSLPGISLYSLCPPFLIPYPTIRQRAAASQARRRLLARLDAQLQHFTVGWGGVGCRGAEWGGAGHGGVGWGRMGSGGE
ncbi:unnamed protein product [Closterium sp. NIES-64]|nr:unnamed protein product [Closterium sp. NIES-64]